MQRFRLIILLSSCLLIAACSQSEASPSGTETPQPTPTATLRPTSTLGPPPPTAPLPKDYTPTPTLDYTSSQFSSRDYLTFPSPSGKWITHLFSAWTADNS